MQLVCTWLQLASPRAAPVDASHRTPKCHAIATGRRIGEFLVFRDHPDVAAAPEQGICTPSICLAYICVDLCMEKGGQIFHAIAQVVDQLFATAIACSHVVRNICEPRGNAVA